MILETRITALEQKELTFELRMVSVELYLMLLSQRIERLETKVKQKEGRKCSWTNRQ